MLPTPMPVDARVCRSCRIVVTTFGPLGDLRPYLAIALGLQRRGHSPDLATSEHGIEFWPLGRRVIQANSPGFVQGKLAGKRRGRRHRATGFKVCQDELLLEGEQGPRNAARQVMFPAGN